MNKTKLIALLLVTTTLLLVFGGTALAADFGSGVAVLAEGTEIIRTAISGKKIIFSDVDIKQGLCLTDFEAIEITEIPESTEGTLMLAGRRVGVGTVIKRKNIGALVFIPASTDVAECHFSFKCAEFADGAEVKFTLKFTEKVNYAPKIDEDAVASGIVTQREVGVFGKMQATDKEGDELEYVIIRYPERGNIELINKNSGEFLYTPPVDYVGEDSFTYVARDEWGNYSRPVKEVITVTERKSEVVYADMKEHREYNAAIALTAMGVVDGRLLGDGVYFMPDDTVTLAEFVTMAMKCAGIRPDTTLTETYFDDGDEITPQLVSYIATAARLGIVQGEFCGGELLLCPNSPVTVCDAAMIMAAITDAEEITEGSVVFEESTVPVWNKRAIYEMCSLGIFDSDEAQINGSRALTKAECVGYLYKMCGVLER